MKKVFKLIGKIALWVLSSIVSLVILVLVVLNIAKFAIPPSEKKNPLFLR